MRHARVIHSPVSMLAVLLALSACGGGGSGSDVSSTPPPPAPAPAPAPVQPVYNTQEYRDSSGPDYHDALAAYEAGASGAGITVGIVDTGIDTDSREFTGRISSSSIAFNGTGSIEDDDGHGTAVAGVLAAARNNRDTLGMAWGATIMALRTDDPNDCDDGSCSHPVSYIAQALDHAVANGAGIINISLGGDFAGSQVRNAVDRATAAGVIVVISGGNDSRTSPSGFATSISDPAISRGLVIIATSNNDEGQHSDFANGAAGYENVTLSALGEEVLAYSNDGILYLWSGTSFAAPQIAGAVALMREAFPNLTPQQVVDRLMSTATDAGLAGPDAEFGRGIVDLAAAFAPAGATSLGEGKTPVSLVSNGTLSNAMGDAAGAASASAVTIDSLGRAYSISLNRTLTPGAAHLVLRPLHYQPARQAALAQGGFAGSLSFRDQASYLNRFGEPVSTPARGGVSSQLITRPTPGVTAGLAYGLNASSLRTGMGESGAAGASFLAAQSAESSMGFQPSPRLVMGVRHRLSEDWNVSITGENGEIEDLTLRANETEEPSSYVQTSATLDGTSGPFSFRLSGSLLDEPDTLLGARLASFFGVSGSRTIFADAEARAEFAGGWSLGASVRRGWTRATGDGDAQFNTLAWSADITGQGLLHAQDRLGLRLSQPLRLVSGGVDTLLPISHDYASGKSEWAVGRVNLSPKGRELDAEVSYARPLAGGWLSLNGYVRREPGHIEWAGDDIGAALRFTLGY